MVRVKNYEVRSYIPEKQQKGRRNWRAKAEEQRAVYANQRRYATAARNLCSGAAEMSGTQLHARIAETGRHAALPSAGTGERNETATDSVGAFNLGLVMRKLLGAGTPREA